VIRTRRSVDPPPRYEITLNHPFLLFITLADFDKNRGASLLDILFVGKVSEPNSVKPTVDRTEL